eukprot:3756942-Prymnesium_polylepis.2
MGVMTGRKHDAHQTARLPPPTDSRPSAATSTSQPCPWRSLQPIARLSHSDDITVVVVAILPQGGRGSPGTVRRRDTCGLTAAG